MLKTRVAIAGATGNVGREMIRLMEERQMFQTAPILLASSVSADESVPFGEGSLNVQMLKDFDFKNIDVIVFATPKEVSEVYVPKAQAAGVKVLDLSSYLRADEKAIMYFDGVSKDLSNRTDTVTIPSVSALSLARVLNVLAQEGLQLTHVTTTAMCPVSMAGREAMDELFAQSAALLGGAGAEQAMPENFKVQMAYNVIPQVGDFQGAHTDTEVSIIMETNRALTQPVPLTAMAVYVPTFVGSGQAVTLDVANGFDLAKIRSSFEKADGVTLIDNPEKQEYSTPFGTAETDNVYVSRIREDMLSQGKLQLWITTDNLRLAALSALNAITKIS